jgi:hypothetical protein
MAENNKLSDFPKELFFSIPLLGSALAITFDVGYFFGIDINFFTLFSLSEHIVFSFEALPFTLIFAATLVVGNATWKLGREHERKARESNEKAVRAPRLSARFVDVSTMAIFCGMTIFSYWQGWYSGAVFSALCALVTVLITGWPRLFFNMFTMTVFGVFAVFAVTFALGYESAQHYITAIAPTHIIEFDSTKQSGKLIRAGDRGLLFLDSATKQIGLVRWDGIKRIFKQHD